MSLKRAFVLIPGVLACCALPASAQTVRSGTGANTAALQAIVDQFRTDLGGGFVAGAAGSFGGIRREINWDAVPAAFSAPNNLPANFFNANSPRGAEFSFPGGSNGTGFMVSDNVNPPTNGVGPRFQNLNAQYPNEFTIFSSEKLFIPLTDNIYDTTFFLAGTNTPGFVRGFGAVFTDVDLIETTSIEFFDFANQSLGVFTAPVLDKGLSFLGVSFDNATIGRVRITQGNLGTPFAENPNAVEFPSDIVAADDFIYSEPGALAAAAPEPGTFAFLALGIVGIAFRCRKA
jgi:hypothetical protein